jgi:hypothetical protein
MLRPNLLFASWRELPASILVLHFTDPIQPVTQIEQLIDFKDQSDREKLIQFLSIFGWTLHDQLMTSIPCFHLDRSIGKMLSLNVSAANGKVIGYQPDMQEELSLAAIWREIAQLKRCLSAKPPPKPEPHDIALEKMKNRYAKVLVDVDQPRNHHQPWTPKEDTQLREEYESGEDIQVIATTHNRSDLAIRSRLLKLQLITV